MNKVLQSDGKKQAIIYDPRCAVDGVDGLPVAAKGRGLCNWHPRGLVCGDFDDFSRICWVNRDCVLVIDEAYKLSKEGKLDELRKIATWARNKGHFAIFCSQIFLNFDTTIRSMCTHAMGFRMRQADAEAMAAEYNQPAFLQCGQLQPCHYIYADNCGSFFAGKTF